MFSADRRLTSSLDKSRPMNRRTETISLIGAGLTGPLLAILLVKRGFRVEIYERRPDMRRVRISAGRSINLALSVRGIHALTEAGLWNPRTDNACANWRAHLSALRKG